MPSWRSNLISSLRLLGRNPLYLVLALGLAFLLFAVYFTLNDLALYRSVFSISTKPAFLWKVFANQVSMIWRISGLPNVLAIGLVAALGGTNLSLAVFRTHRTGVLVGRPGILSFFGSLTGAFAASCAACSTALISLLGVTGGLAIFPFGGLEISLVAILVLGAALYYTARSLAQSGLLENG